MSKDLYTHRQFATEYFIDGVRVAAPKRPPNRDYSALHRKIYDDFLKALK